MSTRLNKENRAGIRNAVIQYRFKKDFDVIVRARAALADDIYGDLYDPPMFVLMRSLPKGYLPTQQELSITLGTSHTYIGFSGGWHRWSTPAYAEAFAKPSAVWRLVAYDHDNRHAKTYDARHPFTIEFDRIQNLGADLATDTSEAAAKLDATTKSVTTVEKLIELWPEIEPFARPYMVATTASSNRQLPVIQTAALNTLLDLPVPTELPRLL